MIPEEGLRSRDMARDNLTYWDPQQVIDAMKAIRKEHGSAWAYMVPVVREALVDRYLVHTFLKQRGGLPVEAIRELYNAVHEAMGTFEEE